MSQEITITDHARATLFEGIRPMSAAESTNRLADKKLMLDPIYELGNTEMLAAASGFLSTKISKQEAAAGSGSSQMQPGIASSSRSTRGAGSKVASTRASAKTQSPPAHAIFKECADITDDPYWKEIFVQMSRKSYRRWFRYIPGGCPGSSAGPASGSSTSGGSGPSVVGRLIFKYRLKEVSLNVSSIPAVAAEEVKAFMRTHGCLISDSEKRSLEESQSHEPPEVANKWSKVRGEGTRMSLISHFARTAGRMSGAINAAELSVVISTSMCIGHFSDQNIHMRRGLIDRISGIAKCPDTGVIYPFIRLPASAASSSTSSSAVSADVPCVTPKGVANMLHVFNSSLGDYSTTPAPYVTVSGDVLAEDAAGQPPPADETARARKVSCSSRSGVAKPPVPLSIFTTAAAVCEHSIFDMNSRTLYGDNAIENISTALPSPEETDEFVEWMCGDGVAAAALVAPLATAIGYASTLEEGVAATDRTAAARAASVARLPDVISAVGPARPPPFKSEDNRYVFLPDPTTRVLEGVVCGLEPERYGQKIASIAEAPGEAAAELIRKYASPEIVAQIRRAGKAAKRTETLLSVFTEKGLRARAVAVSHVRQSLEAGSSVALQDPESSSVLYLGASAKAGASLKKWYKFCTDNATENGV